MGKRRLGAMSHLPRLAVFDVDGTLIDSQHNIVSAMTAACRAHGIEQPAPESVRRIIGLSLVEAVAALLPRNGHDDHLRVAHSYKEAFAESRRRHDPPEPMFPGAGEALAALAADGWLLGIATGKSRRGVAVMLERCCLEGAFVTIQTADGNPGKPHPAMLLNAMDAVGGTAQRTVMIGDTTFDMQMARSARTAAVGVAWGYHGVEELLAAGAEALVEHYRALPEALAEAMRERECALAPP